MHGHRVVWRTLSFMLALHIIAGSISAIGSKEKTPEEQAADNQKNATSEYNDGVKAMDQAREILKKGDSAYAFNYRATSDAKARKKFESALDKFTKATTLNPGFPEAWNNMGYCYRKLGKLPESLDAYDKAIGIRGDYAQAREYRAETYLALGQLENARKELDFLRQMNSPYADSLSQSIERYQLVEFQKKNDSSR